MNMHVDRCDLKVALFANLRLRYTQTMADLPEPKMKAKDKADKMSSIQPWRKCSKRAGLRLDLGSLVLLPIFEEFGLLLSIKLFEKLHALDGKMHFFELVHKLLD
jgi:hypothetical protein